MFMTNPHSFLLGILTGFIITFFKRIMMRTYNMITYKSYVDLQV